MDLLRSALGQDGREATSPVGLGAMESLVLRSLVKMRKLLKSSVRKEKAARDSCDAIIDWLRQRGGTEEGAAEGQAYEDTDADKYFEPFKLACETRSPRVMEVALDALQKLVAYGYLKGNSTVPASTAHALSARRSGSTDTDGDDKPSTELLIDQVVETIAECGNDQPDENVQLQVLKALLECVISKNTEVHGGSLLNAIRSCYNIHLTSKNPVNKTTAKATLTQMLSIVFHRMEAFDHRAREEAAAALQAMETCHTTTHIHTHTHTPSDASNAQTKQTSGVAVPPSPSTTAAAPPATEALPCGASMYPAVYVKLGFIPLGKCPIPLAQKSGTAPEFPSVLHRDAYLLFRALCRLSVKNQSEDPNPSGPAEQTALYSKTISLELILAILEHAGPSFRSLDKFIFLVRNHLCTSLLKNATSSNTVIVGLSLRIFIAMLTHFKDSLKAEIEVFISNIFLRLLESENSSFEHKMLVLEVFNNLCQDPQLLIEIFLNYDCDLGATSMFARIVSALAKVAHGRKQDADVLSANRRQAEDAALRTSGLEGLVAITHSLVKAGGMTDEEVFTIVHGKGGSPLKGESYHEGEGGLSESVAPHLPNAGPSLQHSNSNHAISPPEYADAILDQTQPLTAMSVVESYDRKQRLQEELSMGLLKFNLKPSAGLAYLEKHGHLQHTPQDVARFLHDYAERLEKTVIGDYLGKEKEYDHGFCVKVLHEYVDMMDFQNMAFDDAIRHFLAGFRLPGEAQKIDRIMEKFAERYCLQNLSVFPSADTAFILSFSTIMLNTDLHNPSIREDRKMTKEDFVRNNRGISAGADLPEAFLSRIYDNIKKNPITLREDEEARAKMAAASGAENPFLSTLSLDKRRKEAYQKEREAMVQASEALFRQRKRREGATGAVAFRAPTVVKDEYVRPMFEVAWGPMLSVFAHVVKSSEDDKMIGLSLRGFRYCIRIAARFGIATARDLLVNSIFKFTMLNEITEMRPKNIECIRSLITVALTDGNHLGESWLDVLQCISHLARLQLFASGLQTDEVYFPPDRATRVSMPGTPGGSIGPHRKKTSGGLDPFRLFSGPTRAEAARQVEEFNAEQISGAIDQSMIERVFTTSHLLDSEAVQHFVIKLCEVSRQEVTMSHSGGGFRSSKDMAAVADSGTPRVFSLQKLVEVADFNMTSRSRLVWANVWEVLSKHFAAVGLHENQNVAMFAIDSLRQLSIKFLYKDELRDFNFQRLFLKPFEIIMASARTLEMRELVLRCIDNLISARAHNIRSGWKSIFAVLSIASTSPDEGIAQYAFDMTDHLFRNHFDLLVFDFVDLVNCLLSFAENGYHLHISLAAIAHLQRAATLLADGHVDAQVVPKAARSGSFGGPASVTELLAGTTNTPTPTTTLNGTSIPPSLSTSAATQLTPTHITTGANGPSVCDSATLLPPPSPAGEQGPSQMELQLQLWWPLLVGLSARVADHRLPARTSALEALIQTLRQHGAQFSAQTWKLMFRGVLFPLLESARTDCTPQVISEYPARAPQIEVRDDSWILTTTETVLRSYVEVLRAYYTLTQSLIPEVLGTICDCICQHERETLARIAMRVMHRDVLALAHDMKDLEVWDALTVALLGIVRKNLPEREALEMLAQAADYQGGSAASPVPSLPPAPPHQPHRHSHPPPHTHAHAHQRPHGTKRGVHPPTQQLQTSLLPNGPSRSPPPVAPAVADASEADHDHRPRSSSSHTTTSTMPRTPVHGDDDDDAIDDDDTEEEEDMRESGFGGGLVGGVGGGEGGGGAFGSDRASFSFAMAHNGTVMTQFVVTLLAQQLIRDLLSKSWPFLSEANLVRLFDALIESAEYAKEFNGDLSLRERLVAGSGVSVRGGIMHMGVSVRGQPYRQQHMQQQQRQGMITRLPHLHEQAIEGYSTLLGCALEVYGCGERCPVSDDEGALTWDRRPVMEKAIVSYVTTVLRHYVALEESIVHRRQQQQQHPPHTPVSSVGGGGGNLHNSVLGGSSSGGMSVARQRKTLSTIAAAEALNSEVSAYTPLVLYLFRTFKAYTVEQLGRHLPWLYDLVVELVTVRSLEVRREVRQLLLEHVRPFTLGQTPTPPSMVTTES